MGNNDINATLHGALCVTRGADRVKNSCSAVLGARDQRRWIALEERDHPNTLVKTHRKPIFLTKFKVQVHAERARRQSARLANLPADRISVGTPKHKHAQSAGITYGSGESRTGGTSHWGLYDWHFNSKAIAKSCLHRSLPFAVLWARAFTGSSTDVNVQFRLSALSRQTPPGRWFPIDAQLSLKHTTRHMTGWFPTADDIERAICRGIGAVLIGHEPSDKWSAKACEPRSSAARLRAPDH
ncbi:MAG: hypothetical protein ACREDL_16525 [Bradyrhizobium sp.]